jgi:very-short-patch-repair endonuclease
MSFRDRMRVNVSRAEETLAVALQQCGLAKGLFMGYKISLISTTPDFFWPTKGVAVYLDGPPHVGREDRDDRITEILEKRGIKVLRFPYRPPLSQRRLKEIVAAIEEALK